MKRNDPGTAGRSRAGVHRAAVATGLVFSAWVLLAAFATFHHEPWRDEAQAWLIARDLPLGGVIAQMGYEGSPALWHLLLFPFARSGAPYASEAVIHLLLAVAGVGLLLWRAPFPLWFKALLAFSGLLSYEYAAVARNYNLTLLLLFALATLHPARRRRPLLYGLLVALLANANVHSFALAAGLAALFAFEARGDRDRRAWLVGGLAIMALGLAAALAQLGMEGRNELVGSDLRPNLKAPLAATRNAWLPGFPNAAAPVAAAAMALVVLALWRRARPALFLLGCGLTGLYAIFALKHSGGLRHHGLILVMTVYALWIAWDRLAGDDRCRWRRALLGTLGVLLAAGLPFSARTHVADARGIYSGARGMAAYLNGSGLAGRTLVAYPSAPTSAVLPYLPGKHFWYADIQAPGTFVTWNRRYADNHAIGVAEAARRAVGAPGWGPGALLLLNEPLPTPEAFGLALRHQVADGVYTGFGEQMYLYEREP
jgi:hypothetical protein